MPKIVRDMEIDEVSLVDVPANQFAKTLIAKRAQEDAMPQYFYADGTPVGEDDELQTGMVVQDENGNQFGVSFEPDEAETVAQDERELATVGKAYSAFDKAGDLERQVRADLSKALTTADQNEAIAKGFAEIAKREARAEEILKRAERAEEIAKREYDIRVEREYIAKAAELTLPVDPSELGPVLKRLEETMSEEDCAVIAKALTASSAIFDELGFTGDPDAAADPYEAVEKFLEAEAETSVAKSGATPVSKGQSLRDFYRDNPGAYDAYVREID